MSSSISNVLDYPIDRISFQTNGSGNSSKASSPIFFEKDVEDFAQEIFPLLRSFHEIKRPIFQTDGQIARKEIRTKEKKTTSLEEKKTYRVLHHLLERKEIALHAIEIMEHFPIYLQEGQDRAKLHISDFFLLNFPFMSYETRQNILTNIENKSEEELYSFVCNECKRIILSSIKFLAKGQSIESFEQDPIFIAALENDFERAIDFCKSVINKCDKDIVLAEADLKKIQTIFASKVPSLKKL